MSAKPVFGRLSKRIEGLRIRDQPGLHSEFPASLGSIVTNIDVYFGRENLNP
jgi:hypothetical protein